MSAVPAGDQEQRLAELSENLREVTERIRAACAAAGRDPGGVRLIAVTKTFPASDVMLLSRLGITEIGENRDQEAAPKAEACAAAGVELNWHFVGQLQTRKCASVVRYAAVVHSVDREHLVRELGRRAVAAGREISCLIQVNLDPGAGPGPVAGHGAGDGAGRGGALPARVPELAALIAATGGLRLGGVMAVAPAGAPARPAFARLRELASPLAARYPGAGTISAGMSGDLEDAIAEGATHVRVGTALLGGRPLILR